VLRPPVETAAKSGRRQTSNGHHFSKRAPLLGRNLVAIGSEAVQPKRINFVSSGQEFLLPCCRKETTMLRNTLLAAVAVAMMPAIAMAAPVTAPKKAPTAMTSTVKAEKVTLMKHHAKAKAVKTTVTLKHKAKVTTIKS
jgi:hypothetical protein